MTDERNCTVATTSVMPCLRSRTRMCSIIGRFTMGSMGLGMLLVSGRRREPSPPAMITACMSSAGTSTPLHGQCTNAVTGGLRVHRRRDPVEHGSEDGKGGAELVRYRGAGERRLGPGEGGQAEEQRCGRGLAGEVHRD